MADAPNPLKRDRFELLSAYLDGEVSPDERRQVEAWLATDPSIQHLYARLLKIRQGMRTLPVPAPSQSPEVTAQRVMTRLERRPRKMATWGGVAIAAMFIGVISSLTPPLRQPVHQLAIEHSPTVSTDALMIALDRPILEIPGASGSPVPNSLQQSN